VAESLVAVLADCDCINAVVIETRHRIARFTCLLDGNEFLSGYSVKRAVFANRKKIDRRPHVSDWGPNKLTTIRSYDSGVLKATANAYVNYFIWRNDRGSGRRRGKLIMPYFIVRLRVNSPQRASAIRKVHDVPCRERCASYKTGSAGGKRPTDMTIGRVQNIQDAVVTRDVYEQIQVNHQVVRDSDSWNLRLPHYRLVFRRLELGDVAVSLCNLYAGVGLEADGQGTSVKDFGTPGHDVCPLDASVSVAERKKKLASGDKNKRVPNRWRRYKYFARWKLNIPVLCA